MQQNKGTKKISDIGEIASNPERLTSSLSSVIDKFNIKKHFVIFDCLKSKGLAISSLISILIILPFLGVASVYTLFKHGAAGIDFEGKKDVYYDLKNNPFISWRLLLSLHAKRFKYLMNRNISLKKDGVTAMIFDDTVLDKTGKKIEKIGYVHNHAGRNFYVLGFKLLVCGFWDGGSFVPIDFSLHREKGTKHKAVLSSYIKAVKSQQRASKVLVEAENKVEKQKARLEKAIDAYESKPNKPNADRLEKAQNKFNMLQQKMDLARKDLSIKEKQKVQAKSALKRYYKKGYLYGLNGKERREQYKKAVSSKSAGFTRRKEADKDKISSMIEMLARAVKNGYLPDYVLIDSWFFCYEILDKLQKLKKGAIKLISMVRVNNQIFTLCSNDKLMSAKNILKNKERHASGNRKYKAKYIKVPCLYKGIRVNLFFILMGRSSNWHLLLTSDLTLNFNKLMEIYQIRWSIEVFFKECKQYLNLGGSKSSNFDAQIADTTISMMQHILLSYYKRVNDLSSFSGLFIELNREIVKYSILTQLLGLFWTIVNELCSFIGIDFITFYDDVIRNDEVMEKIIKLFPEQQFNKAS